MRKPPPLGTEALIGPKRLVADWAPLEATAGELEKNAMDDSFHVDVLHRRLGELYQNWADQAELELVEGTYAGHDMPKKGLRGRAPVLVWRSILPERAERSEDGNGVRWRNLANSALDVQRMLMDVRARTPAPTWRRRTPS